MNPVKVYLRIRDKEALECIILNPVIRTGIMTEDILWESSGAYYLEAFQCGSHPSICSIEKDPRILNPKEEIALLILDEINKTHGIEA